MFNSKLWACESCSEHRGWKCFKTGNTITQGICGWCNTGEVQWLTPLEDMKDEQGIRADISAHHTRLLTKAMAEAKRTGKSVKVSDMELDDGHHHIADNISNKGDST